MLIRQPITAVVFRETEMAVTDLVINKYQLIHQPVTAALTPVIPEAISHGYTADLSRFTP